MSKKLEAIAEDLYQAIKWANFPHIKVTGRPTFHMMTAMVRYEQYVIDKEKKAVAR